MTRWLAFLSDLVETARRRRAMRDALARLDDHLLADIGIERIGIDAYVAACCPTPDLEQRHGRAFAPTLQGCG